MMIGVWLFCGAEAGAVDFGATIEKDIQTTVVNTDGTWEMTRDLTILIDDDSAINSVAQQALHYNGSLETVDILEAYTQKSDGRKVAVQLDRIKEQQEPYSANVAMFEDSRVKVVIFPEVERADRLILKTRQRQTTAIIPGQFQHLAIPPFFTAKEVRLVFDMPDSLPLFADARGYSSKILPAAPGRKRYQYDYLPDNAPAIDQRAVSYLDYGNRLALSTMADYGVLAAAYEAGAKGMAKVRPRIAELARKIAGGSRTPRAKALALSNWVRKKIRYVAVYVGAGGIVPHAADEVLEHRYGDCKDHATLLEALLAAEGIDSTQALINGDNAYTLLKVPALGMLNHVINYVPQLDLYLDSTAAAVGAGYLPQGDLDKQTILTKTGKIGHTPATQKNRQIFNLEITVAPNGAADVIETLTAQGVAAELKRYSFRNTKPSERAFDINSEATYSFDAGALDGQGDEYIAKQTSHFAHLLVKDSPWNDLAFANLNKHIHWSVTVNYSTNYMVERTQAFPCASEEIEEHIRIKLPKNFRIVEDLPAREIHHAGLDYTSKFGKEGDLILIDNYYRVHQARAVCTADDHYKTMQADHLFLMGNSRSWLRIEAL